jgi:preprotein translocase subunit SecY
VAFRTYLRIALIVALAALIWRRWSAIPTTRLILTGAALLMVVGLVFQMTSALRKSRKLRDEVPKHPLGLE